MKKATCIKVFFILLICSAIFFGFIYYRNLMRLGRLKGLATSLVAYANENEECLPDLNQWSQILVSQGYCSQELFSNKKLNYAINKHVKGMKIYEIPNDMVVFFETEGLGNLVGDYELVKQSDYRWPGCAIQFGMIVDKVKFFDKEEAKKLNWEN